MSTSVFAGMAKSELFYARLLRVDGWLCCYFFFDEDFLRGTFAPARLACDSPMAIACLRLFTFLPERPLLSFPFFRSCIALSTFSDAFFPYLAIVPPCNEFL